MKRNLLIWLFIILTGVNILIFLKRDRFEYRPYRQPEKLYGSCEDDCVEKWQKYAEDYPKGELEKASLILDSVVKQDSTTTQKIIAIASFLRSQFAGRQGVPSAKLLSRSPLGQYDLLTGKSDEKLWCGNWANLFAFFCWSRNIPARIIEIYRPGDHHVVNECYLAEKSSWGLVDLTNGLVLPNENGRVLTTLDLVQNNQRRFENALAANSTSQLSDSLRAYYDGAYPIYYYNRYNLQMIYSSASRLKRYVFPDPWYEIADLDRKAPGNFPFYLKISLVYGWVLTGIVLFIVLVNRRMRGLRR